MDDNAVKTTNDRCDELMRKLEKEVILAGHRESSHEYYAALCGKMRVYLLIEMGHHDFWKNAHTEVLNMLA